MNRPLSLFILALMSLSPAIRAQDANLPPPVRIRAVLHDPVRQTAELFYPDSFGAVQPLAFRPVDFTETVLMQPVNGCLVLFDKAIIDPKNPEASLAGSVKLPPDFQQGIMLVMPAQKGAKYAYQMLLIDDSPKAFPGGESILISFLNLDVAVQAGEHKILVPPGGIARLPMTTQVNEYSMAQTNFYYQHKGSWMAFSERQLQYRDVCRRLFIVHTTPGALQPSVTTIVDVMRNVPPR
ncbi:MAG TPA: hypothetical protein VFY13_05525 [Luteolibacter sp.]|nr:hypothetical protein [Luteolibacter sp.]